MRGLRGGGEEAEAGWQLPWPSSQAHRHADLHALRGGHTAASRPAACGFSGGARDTYLSKRRPATRALTASQPTPVGQPPHLSLSPSRFLGLPGGHPAPCDHACRAWTSV